MEMVNLESHAWLFHAFYLGFLYVTDFILSPIVYCGFMQESKGAEEKILTQIIVTKCEYWKDVILAYYFCLSKKFKKKKEMGLDRTFKA